MHNLWLCGTVMWRNKWLTRISQGRSTSLVRLEDNQSMEYSMKGVMDISSTSQKLKCGTEKILLLTFCSVKDVMSHIKQGKYQTGGYFGTFVENWSAAILHNPLPSFGINADTNWDLGEIYNRDHRPNHFVKATAHFPVSATITLVWCNALPKYCRVGRLALARWCHGGIRSAKGVTVIVEHFPAAAMPYRFIWNSQLSNNEQTWYRDMHFAS